MREWTVAWSKQNITNHGEIERKKGRHTKRRTEKNDRVRRHSHTASSTAFSNWLNQYLNTTLYLSATSSFALSLSLFSILMHTHESHVMHISRIVQILALLLDWICRWEQSALFSQSKRTYVPVAVAVVAGIIENQRNCNWKWKWNAWNKTKRNEKGKQCNAVHIILSAR